jgi:short subunit dehydrogenase-like uncharacterized protein
VNGHSSPRSDRLLIYGASGYSGRLATQAAIALGLRPVLGGRDAAKLAPLAERLGLAYRAVRLEEPESLAGALRDVGVVLHTAGPFSRTARPMLDACLRTGTHYLDIAAEIHVLEALARRDAEARARGIMVMPGVGFDVVPSDCLARHVARRLPGARRLALGIRGLEFVTRGSAKTFVEAADSGAVRRGGAIVGTPAGMLRRTFDFGDGPRPVLNLSWGDVASAYYTTGIPDISVYVETTPALEMIAATSQRLGWLLATGPWQAWLKAHAELLPEGPTDAERAARTAVIVAEAEDGAGRRVAARLRTPEAYTFTAMSAPAVARRVLGGDVELGFQTPARVYGSDFVLGFPGITREDLT